MKKDTNKDLFLNSLRFRSEIYILIGDFRSALTDLERGYKYSINNTIIQKKVEFDLALANIYYILGKIDLCKNYCNEAIKICKENGFKNEEALCLTHLGNLQIMQSNNEKALSIYLEAYSIYDKINKDHVGKVIICLNLSMLYERSGNYEEQLKYIKRSLHLSEKISFLEGISNNLNNLANYHKNKMEYEKSLKLNMEALEIREGMCDKKGVAMSYNNIGVVFSEQEKYKEALEYFTKSYETILTTNNMYGIAFCLYNMARTNYLLKNYKRSIYFFKRSLEIREKINDVQGLMLIYLHMGDALYEGNKHSEAKESYKEFLKYTEKIPNFPIPETVYERIKQ